MRRHGCSIGQHGSTDTDTHSELAFSNTNSEPRGLTDTYCFAYANAGADSFANPNRNTCPQPDAHPFSNTYPNSDSYSQHRDRQCGAVALAHMRQLWQ